MLLTRNKILADRPYAMSTMVIHNPNPREFQVITNPKLGQICSSICYFGLDSVFFNKSSNSISLFRPIFKDYYFHSGTLSLNCSFHVRFRPIHLRKLRRSSISSPATMLLENPVASDICATTISAGIAFFFLWLWKQTAKLGLDQKLNRKLVHISIGLVFMLCWPLFSSGYRGAILASLIPGVNIIRMLVIGLGIYKDAATVKSMSRSGDYRELLRGPLYYATTVTLACIVYWRTSPIAIALICNLCAGDGLADIIGRRFGTYKIPYNKNKSLVGSITMASSGFLTSIGYMYYFSSFGFLHESSSLILGFLVVSLASALVESLPISSELDDNLTVPLTSILVGSLIF